jgi:hypothetical protein
MTTPSLYVLLDANVLAGYYAPKTLIRGNAAERIKMLIDSVRCGCSSHIRLLTPEICMAEAQTVLSKYCIRKWNGHKPKREDPQAIHGKTYRALVRQMRDDLHGGKLIESVPLARYHVLAKKLITTIDHNLRLPTKDGNGYLKELGGTDQLICGTAIWLSRFLGPSRFCVVTADYRLHKVLTRARSATPAQARLWRLDDFARDTFGWAWSREIMPRSIYLPTATETQMRSIFGAWPLPTQKRKAIRQGSIARGKDIETLLMLYKNMAITRDRLPYSDQITQLCQQLQHTTGLSISERELWALLLGRLKKGGGRLQRTKIAASRAAR